MRFVTVFVSLGLALGSAASAQAQVKSPVTIGTHYEQNSTRLCGVVAGVGATQQDNTCKLTFAAAPAGKQILIKRVSCAIASGASIDEVYLASSMDSSGRELRKHRLEPRYMDSQSDVYHYTVDDSVDGYPAIDRPRITLRLTSGGLAEMACQITGRIANR